MKELAFKPFFKYVQIHLCTGRYICAVKYFPYKVQKSKYLVYMFIHHYVYTVVSFFTSFTSDISLVARFICLDLAIKTLQLNFLYYKYNTMFLTDLIEFHPKFYHFRKLIVVTYSWSLTVTTTEELGSRL